MEEKSAYLTDTFPVHFVHLDRITIVGNLNRSNDFFSKWSLNNIDLKEQSLAKLPYRYQYVSHAGYLVQLKEPTFDIPDVRIEFNPTKLTWSPSLDALLVALKGARFTRVDFAIDYEIDLSGYCSQTTVPKKRNIYYSRSGSPETTTIGIKGDKYRIYDKALEQRLSGTLWRIENEVHLGPGDSIFKEQPFSDLTIYNPRFHDLPDFKDRAALYYLTHNPSEWGNLSRRLKSRYRELLRQSDQIHYLWPDPYQLFLAQKDRLHQELRSYLLESGG